MRENLKDAILEGTRAEAIKGILEKEEGISKRKAKFLAHQESSLLMSKFREERYKGIGITKYIWRTVKAPTGFKKGNVRPLHAKLDGTIQEWSNPPIAGVNGDKKNPGESYGCRCISIPLLKI